VLGRRVVSFGSRGLSRRHQDVAAFTARQLLDMVAPSNFIWTNPQVLARTRSQAGMNLVRGTLNLADDLMRTGTGRSPAGFARIHTINGFSAHADQAELLAWHQHTGAGRTFLVHGDEAVMQSFAAKLANTRVETPSLGEAFEL